VRSILAPMRAIAVLLLASLPVPAGAGAAEGVPADDEPTVTLRLVPERASTRPGASARVALVFDIEPGWHIYWSNPGETGLATTATLTADGVAVDGPAYPAPKVHVDAGAIRSYVYEGQTALFWQVPTERRGLLSLAADATWLVCRERCVFQTGTAEAEVRVGAQCRASWAPELDRWAAQAEQPGQPFPGPGRSTGNELRADEVTFAVTAPEGTELVPSLPLEEWATSITLHPGDRGRVIWRVQGPARPADSVPPRSAAFAWLVDGGEPGKLLIPTHQAAPPGDASPPPSVPD
jgi:DsbC/DsbD-like thiol-disulfide interchange protein